MSRLQNTHEIDGCQPPLWCSLWKGACTYSNAVPYRPHATAGGKIWLNSCLVRRRYRTCTLSASCGATQYPYRSCECARQYTLSRGPSGVCSVDKLMVSWAQCLKRCSAHAQHCAVLYCCCEHLVACAVPYYTVTDCTVPLLCAVQHARVLETSRGICPSLLSCNVSKRQKHGGVQRVAEG